MVAQTYKVEVSSNPASCNTESEPLGLGAELLQQGLDITKAEGKGLMPLGIPCDLRDVIRHDHSAITYLSVSPQCAGHIHVSFIGESFLEFEIAAADIAKVNVKDFPSLAKVANDVVNLFTRLGEHFRNGTLAEIEPMIGAGDSLHKTLQACHGAEYGMNAAPASGRHRRILGVQGDFHPSFFSDGHNSF